MSFSLAYLIVVGIIVVVFPIYSILTANQGRKLLIKHPGKLVLVYKQTMTVQVVLTASVLMAMYINGEMPEIIGASILTHPLSLISLLMACTIGWWAINKIELSAANITKLNSQYKDVIYLIPRTKREYQWSLYLSLIAGTLEEIVYRGFLFWQVNQYISLMPAILLVAIVFALAHAGTKLKNMLSTFLLSLLFSAAYYFTGDLWLSMLLHILVDLYAATLGYKLNQKLSKTR